MMFGSRTGTCILTALLLVGAASATDSGNEPEGGWTGPLKDLGIDGSVDAIAQPHNWKIRQVSSYDRTGGNRDGQFAEQIYEGGAMLADLEGPGCVMRIWTRDPWGILYILVDDDERAVLSIPFSELFTGDLELFGRGLNPFSPPFVGESGGGYYCYVPIPFEKSLRIIVGGDEDVARYQVTYAEFPQGTPIESFNLGLTREDERFFKKWRKTWDNTLMRFPKKRTEQFHKSSAMLWPHVNKYVYAIEGPGVITELEMTLDSVDPAIAQNTWLAIFFDGQDEPGVLAPVGDFFGVTSPKSADFNGLVLGNDQGRMWCRYPMPFESSAVIRVLNMTKESVDFAYGITWRPGAIGDQLNFFARYRSGRTVPGLPYRVADLMGQGHFVGCTIAASNGKSLSFLEGDDVYIVDNEPAANFHGTGTDDYFNAGWYFSTGTYSTPTHGTTLKTAEAPTGFSAFRNLVTEPVPFKSSFSFELEHGGRNDQPGMNYSSVAYWYQREREPQVWTIPELRDVSLKR